MEWIEALAIKIMTAEQLSLFEVNFTNVFQHEYQYQYRVPPDLSLRNMAIRKSDKRQKRKPNRATRGGIGGGPLR